MALILTITNAGRAALRNADGSGTRAVRIAAVGVSAAALAPTAATAALPGEIKRITTLSGEAVAADIIHLVVRDETMATYTVRSFAIYLDDGTPFAFYGQGDPIIEKSSQALLLLAIDVTLADIVASQITFGDANFTLPPATDLRAGLIRLATIAEGKAGTDTTRAVTPAVAKASVLDWIGYTPANRRGDTFTGPVAVRHPDRNLGLMLAHSGTGYGFLQLGDAANPVAGRTWHLGSQDDGSFALYQGIWGSGLLRMLVTSTTIAFNGAAMWHAGNDGAGSGLDADLLDGLQASQFVRADQSSTLGTDVALDFANSIFGRALRIGGNGYTAAGIRASVITTNGNLHLDGAAGFRVFLNHYAGDGVNFSDGAGTVVASMSKAGALNAVSVDAPIMNRRGVPLVGFDNDGAGSGLDADLLDGQDGSWYGNIPARLGYTPASRAGDTFTGLVGIRHAGQECGLRIAQAGTGYGFLQLGETANVSWHLGSNGDGTAVLYQGAWGSGVPRLSVTSTTISYNGAVMWHANNDGAGSGLDADLLDGLQSSQFVRSDQSSTLGTDVALDFVNSAFGRAMRVGGNGYTVAGARASVVTTNGNLHLDGAAGSAVFLSFYNGDGVVFGNGASGTVATMSKGGALIAAAVDAALMRRAGTNLVGFDNDGAGSGLDADLLDGQDGSWYGNIPARLGYAPANRAGDTFTGAIGIAGTLKFLSSPFPGSYLQLNDGAQGIRLATTGGVIIEAPGGVTTTAGLGVTGALSRGGFGVYDTGNDGAGSGLDADLLDGRDGDFYRRWANLLDVPGAFPPTGHSHGAADLAGAFAGSLAENGYTVLPNGLILQWMTGPMQAGRTSAANYLQWPIAFPTACFQAFVSTQVQQTGDRADNWFQLVGIPDQNGATIQRQASGTADDIVASAPRVFAIGH